MSTPTEVVVAFFLAVDRRDWPAVRAAMTGPVRTDYTSLGGGEPEELPGDALVGRWRALLPGFDVTQHHLGPLGAVATTDTGTTLACSVRGHHRIGDRDWMVAGSYDLELTRDAEGWRIAGITLHVSYVAGTPTCPRRPPPGRPVSPAAGPPARSRR